MPVFFAQNGKGVSGEGKTGEREREGMIFFQLMLIDTCSIEICVSAYMLFCKILDLARNIDVSRFIECTSHVMWNL